MIGRNTPLGLVLAIVMIGYFSFLGGVEAAYFAENESEYLDARESHIASFDRVRINISAENLTEEFKDINSSEEAEEDLPEWAKEENAPEWAKNLTDSEASASGSEAIEAPRFYLQVAGWFLNTIAGAGERAALAGMSLAWRYGYPVWVLAWAPAIYTGAFSPWIVRAWLRWNERKAREKTRGN